VREEKKKGDDERRKRSCRKEEKGEKIALHTLGPPGQYCKMSDALQQKKGRPHLGAAEESGPVCFMGGERILSFSPVAKKNGRRTDSIEGRGGGGGGRSRVIGLRGNLRRLAASSSPLGRTRGNLTEKPAAFAREKKKRTGELDWQQERGRCALWPPCGGGKSVTLTRRENTSNDPFGRRGKKEG